MTILNWFIKTRTRKILTALAVILAIPALWLAWWLGSPLLINRSVDEQFPMSSSAEVPAGFTRQEVEDTMAGMAKIDDDAMAEPMTETMESAQALLTGNFRDADSFHRGSGTATVYRLGNGAHVLRFEDFRVINGPDLRVMLSGAPDPKGRGEFRSHESVELAPLKGNIGNQNYEIPADLNPSDYRSVVIYCKPFQVLFSVAPLNEAS